MKSLVTSVAVLCAATLLAAEQQGAKPKTDHELIQGTWQVVSAQEAGKSPKIPDDLRFVITADTLFIKPGKDDAIGMKYKLDPSMKPKAMDTTHEIDPGKPISQLAIYTLDGDELKVCLEAAGKPRPMKFESKPGDTTIVWVLKRAK
ncbi:MAG TPA: TIGR03067 domain-containing protein [Gemmataceae bacterium]|nr:TIGR03067 domain-containing protein [Gemmataceae bacterium]